MPAAKKSTKKPAKKSVVGGLKSKPKWKIGFLVLVALLFVATIEYAVYNKIRADRLVAKAGSYTYIGKDANTFAYACKTYIPVYGGVYQIRALFVKSASAYPSTYRISSSRGLSFLNFGVEGRLYWNNVVGTQTINLSALKDDTFRINLYGWTSTQTYTQFASRNFHPSYVVDC